MEGEKLKRRKRDFFKKAREKHGERVWSCRAWQYVSLNHL